MNPVRNGGLGGGFRARLSVTVALTVGQAQLMRRRADA
jgi:hypothetical protein